MKYESKTASKTTPLTPTLLDKDRQKCAPLPSTNLEIRLTAGVKIALWEVQILSPIRTNLRANGPVQTVFEQLSRIRMLATGIHRASGTHPPLN